MGEMIKTFDEILNYKYQDIAVRKIENNTTYQYHVLSDKHIKLTSFNFHKDLTEYEYVMKNLALGFEIQISQNLCHMHTHRDTLTDKHFPKKNVKSYSGYFKSFKSIKK